MIKINIIDENKTLKQYKVFVCGKRTFNKKTIKTKDKCIDLKFEEKKILLSFLWFLYVPFIGFLSVIGSNPPENLNDDEIKNASTQKIWEYNNLILTDIQNTLVVDGNSCTFNEKEKIEFTETQNIKLSKRVKNVPVHSVVWGLIVFFSIILIWALVSII